MSYAKQPYRLELVLFYPCSAKQSEGRALRSWDPADGSRPRRLICTEARTRNYRFVPVSSRRRVLLRGL